MSKMTICEKILAHASAQEKVQAGDLIMADLNLVMGNDITSPVAIKELAKFGKKKVLMQIIMLWFILEG